MRQIKNVSDDAVTVPLLGNRLIQPGDIVDVPDAYADTEFSVHFEEVGSKSVTRRVKEVASADNASTKEGSS